MLDAPRPLDANTLGFGPAIAAAVDAGVSRPIVGIGSSASTDGGSGLLRALGVDFLDGAGERIPLGARGRESLSGVDLSGLRPAVETLVVTDVTNPLVSPAGAAAVFGPQKGLRADQIERVDRALAHYAEPLSGASDRPIRADAEGSGAAGGAGFGLLAWGAELVPGAAEIGRLMGFDRAPVGADLVITGEGSCDGQSGRGKVPGRVDSEASTEGIAAVLSLMDIVGSAERAMAEPRRALTRGGEMPAE
ncbi:glycerate kinase [Microbacterium sp. KNMS]